MTLPFDTSLPATRPVPVTFNTDKETAARLRELAKETGLDRSLILHRIVTEALELERRGRKPDDSAA